MHNNLSKTTHIAKLVSNLSTLLYPATSVKCPPPHTTSTNCVIAHLLTAHPTAYNRLLLDLKSNHAGEFGAVHIYRGALAALTCRSWFEQNSTSSVAVQQFVHQHMQTEQLHLTWMEQLVPSAYRTKLIPAWYIAGFSLGFLPTLFGGQYALFRTIQYVESFVETHYQEQIDWLQQYIDQHVSKSSHDVTPLKDMIDVLSYCCADEVAHRDDAFCRAHSESPNTSSNLPLYHPTNRWPFLANTWHAIVKYGSIYAVTFSKRW